MLSSFTRAAAHELGDRKTPISRDMIGTLHHFAYQALGMPKLTETLVKDWNAQYQGTNPGYVLSESLAQNTEPESGGATDGDKLLNRVEIYRARMQHILTWEPEYVRFWNAWCEFKKETGSLDFTDLIETCLRDVPVAHGDPTVGFFDESQDLTKLEFSLISRWGKNMEFFFIVGDPDQAIFTWKGADPDVFIDPPTPAERTRVLSQSHRVPRNIHDISQDWINRLSKRFPAEYKPRDYDGTIDAPMDVTFKDAYRLVQHAERSIVDGRTVMFLTSCGYQLQPLIGTLREWGIPFHNPYRRKNGGWNPLYARKGTTTADRVRAFLSGQPGTGWTGSELQRWVHMLAVKDNLVKGARKIIDGLDDEYMFEPPKLAQWFEPTPLKALLARDVEWLRKHMLAQYQSSSKYILKVIERGGVQALDKTPNVCVGTIHSVKGAESDVVYLDPSLSWAGIQKWNQGECDPVIRQYYVGITRARESLVICRGAPNTEIRLPISVRRV